MSCFAFVPQVTVNPSRSGRMDLFSLMQSIQLDDEERLSDLEVLFTKVLVFPFGGHFENYFQSHETRLVMM